jgi:hypothetical protein
LNTCAKRLYAEKVNGHVDLAADWAGWRLRGKWLVSPEGDRINALRLRGILFRESGEKRVSKAKIKNGLQGSVFAFPDRKTNRDELGVLLVTE